MENQSNVSQKEAKATVGKPPNRLQKHAIASLQLDKAASGAPTDTSAVSGETSKAISFLSPLILSLQPLPETVEKRLGECGSNEQDNGEERSEASSPGGWQLHPAVPPRSRSLRPCLLAFNHSACWWKMFSDILELRIRIPDALEYCDGGFVSFVASVCR